MSNISADEQIAWWKNQETYRTSGCCIGRLDGGVLAADGEKKSLVVRGWIFLESSILKSLTLQLLGCTTEAVPIHLYRDDVVDNFPSIPNAKDCGFLAVFDIGSMKAELEPTTHVFFEGLTEKNEIVAGSFEPTQIRLNLLDSEVLSPSSVKCVAARSFVERTQRVLLITPTLASPERTIVHSQLSKMFYHEQISIEILETKFNAPWENETNLFLHKLSMNYFRHIVVYGDNAMDFIGKIQHAFLSSLLSSQVHFIPASK